MSKGLTIRKFFFFVLLCLSLMTLNAQENRPSVALVLGGGGARGFAHIAILELIEELGIPIDLIAGVSSGAIIGGLYSIGYSPAMILEAVYAQDWASFFVDRPVSPFPRGNERLPLSVSLRGPAGTIAPGWGFGYSTGQRAYELFKSLTVKIPSYQHFDLLPIPFRAGAVEVPAGIFKLFEEGDLAEAIRASMSIQGVFQPFVIDGYSFVDGGLLNVLPIRAVRELGFDIVIAVDLFSPPNEFSVAPLDLPELMNTLFSNMMSAREHIYADLVLFPLPPNVPSMMNFARGLEIYSMALAEREKHVALLQPILEVIFPDGVPEEYLNRKSLAVYKEKPYLVPEKLIIHGALARDYYFIHREFNRLIRGYALQEDNVSAFLDSIYASGNYQMVTVRTDIRYGETRMEVTLFPQTYNMFFLRLGLDYEGTFSSQSFDRMALRNGFEFQNRDGFSLLLRTSIMDELSAGLSVFRPMGPRFFLSGFTELVSDQRIREHNLFHPDSVVLDRLFYFQAALRGGLLLNSNNSLSLSPNYFRAMKDGLVYSVPGITAVYTFTSLDQTILPSRGFYFRLCNRFRFAQLNNQYFHQVRADFAYHVPLGRRFSFGFQGFGSYVFGQPEHPFRIDTFEDKKVSRRFFPHAAGLFYTENKKAFSLSLQYEPLENFGILGSRLIFFLAAAAGASSKTNSWENFGRENITGNLSFGTAFIPARSFFFMGRAGVGGGNGLRPTPFVSLDIGASRFKRNLF